MPALSVSVPFPVFQNRDGQPLDNGYVYIGTVNLDAQTNPVQVYFDEDLTIPAAQPLRTINGYVSNAGTPAQLYVNAVNFSIKLLDAKGTFVYSFNNGTQSAQGTYTDWIADTFTGNGVQTLFVLERPPGSVGNCDVSVNGLTLVPNTEFSLSGAILTFVTAPANGATILVRYGAAATQISATFSTELQTATAGQTIFSLNDLIYDPGTNALAVYVNGLRMVSGVDFLETSTEIVTFISGLTLGDEVLFIAGRTINESIGAEAVSYLPGGTGAVATTVQTKLRESVSVKDFGAVGDGVTDDTAAIQAALNAFPAVGGVLFAPKGSYYITQTINVTKPILIVGEGFTPLAGSSAATQILKAASLSGAALALSALGSGVENVGLQGVAGNGGNGIHITGGRTVLRNVSVHGMGSDGIRVGAATQTNCNQFDHQNIHCRSNGGHGYHVDDEFYRNNTSFGANCNNGVIKHIDTTSNGGDGIRINGAWHCSVENSLTQTNGGYGLNIVNTGVTNIGARYTVVLGGEQDEGNTAGEINNSGFNSVMLGVTPGAGGLTETGTNTVLITPGFSAVDVLRIYNFLTSERPTSGGIDYPIISKTFGNTSANRGAGYEIQIPNGSGTSRVAGRIAAAQESTNIDYLSLIANNSGVMTEYARVSAFYGAFLPGADQSYTLGRTAARWSRVYSDGMSITDGVSAPATVAGFATIYVDTADGDLKVKFGDGTVKTIVTDT